MDIIVAILLMSAAVGGAFLIFWLEISNIFDLSEEDLTEELEQTLERDLSEYFR